MDFCKLKLNLMKNLPLFLFYLFCFSLSPSFSQDCNPDEVLITVVMETDAWGYETYWSLGSQNGDIYISVTENTYSSYETYQHEACVPKNECSLLSIFDGFGDGGVTYSVLVDGILVLSESTMQGSFESFEFNCLPGTGCGSPLPISEGNHIASQANSWFVFTPDSIGTYLVSTCDINTCDTKIWIYESCPPIIDDSNEGTIYYNDDFCETQASIDNAILNVGESYIIRIGDNNLGCDGETIHFSISYNGAVVGCTDPNSCTYNPLATIDDGSCIPFGSPDCPNAPDLAIDQGDLVSSIYLTTINNTDNCAIEEGCIQGYGQRDIIRFTTTIHNLGDADYFIGEPNSNPDQFTYDNCHNHHHYDGYAEYLLYDENGTETPIGSTLR